MSSNRREEDLALNGGSKGVTHSSEDRWPPLPVDAAKTAIGALLDEGIITIAKADPIG